MFTTRENVGKEFPGQHLMKDPQLEGMISIIKKRPKRIGQTGKPKERELTRKGW